MTDDDARTLIRAVLAEVAPEADLDSVGPDETMQEAPRPRLHRLPELRDRPARTDGARDPPHDYPELSTVEGCVHYLTASSG